MQFYSVKKIRIKPGVFILFVSHLKITNHRIPLVKVLSMKSLDKQNYAFYLWYN